MSKHDTAKAIARETGGDVRSIERCLESQPKQSDKFTLLDAITDLATAPLLGGTAVLRDMGKKK